MRTFGIVFNKAYTASLPLQFMTAKNSKEHDREKELVPTEDI